MRNMLAFFFALGLGVAAIGVSLAFAEGAEEAGSAEATEGA